MYIKLKENKIYRNGEKDTQSMKEGLHTYREAGIFGLIIQVILSIAYR